MFLINLKFILKMFLKIESIIDSKHKQKFNKLEIEFEINNFEK